MNVSTKPLLYEMLDEHRLEASLRKQKREHEKKEAFKRCYAISNATNRDYSKL